MRHILVPILSSRNYIFAIAAKKHANVDIKFFLACLILPNFSVLFQIFCPGL